MTPAVRALEAAGVPFTLHTYEPDEDRRDVGRKAAAALGIDPDRVFKTIVVDADGREAVAIVPVSCQVAPKAVAAALGAKRVDRCDQARAERVTGYVVGGISPFGQKRSLPVVIDDTCELHETILVSGGRRGLNVELAPADLIAVLAAVVADIAVG